MVAPSPTPFTDAVKRHRTEGEDNHKDVAHQQKRRRRLTFKIAPQSLQMVTASASASSSSAVGDEARQLRALRIQWEGARQHLSDCKSSDNTSPVETAAPAKRRRRQTNPASCQDKEVFDRIVSALLVNNTASPPSSSFLGFIELVLPILLPAIGLGSARALSHTCRTLRLDMFKGSQFWESTLHELRPSFRRESNFQQVADHHRVMVPVTCCKKERFTRFLHDSLTDLQRWSCWIQTQAVEAMMQVVSVGTVVDKRLDLHALVAILLRRANLIDDGLAALNSDYRTEAAICLAEKGKAEERAAQAEQVANAAEVDAVRRLSSEIAGMHRKIADNCGRLATLLEERTTSFGGCRELLDLTRSKLNLLVDCIKDVGLAEQKDERGKCLRAAIRLVKVEK